MPKFKFNKLVRDKIVDLQIASGAQPKYHKLSPARHKRELVNKIIEEAGEITNAKQAEVVGEIADVQQAIDDLITRFGLTKQDIAKPKTPKTPKTDRFKKVFSWKTSKWNKNNDWVKYYRQNAGPLSEIK